MSFRELVRQHPFFRFLFPLVVGILISGHISFGKHIEISIFSIGLLGAVLFVFIPFLRKSYPLRWMFGTFVFLLFFAVGSYRCNELESENQLKNIDSTQFFIGKLSRPPVEKKNSFSCVLQISNSCQSGIWEKDFGKAMIYFQKDSMASCLNTGDKILIKTKLQKVKNSGNPYEFDYAGYLKTQHILYSSYVASTSWQKLKEKESFSLREMAWNRRSQLLDIYKDNGINGESFDILAALTLGYKTGIDPEIKKAWSDAGAMHVLAVSGLHVGIIYLVMNYILGFLARYKWGRFFKGFTLLVALWFYALLTGLSPSVMRAACMFSFIVLGEMLNRKGSVFNSLAASAFFLLLIDPFLLFTVGFQFSYLAVAGIVFLQPKFDQLLYIGNPLIRRFWQLTTVAIAAQIATFPLAIYYFNQFPSYFLLSGYLVISMAGILIYLSALLLLLSPFELISGALGWLLQNMVKIMNWAIIAIQDLPGAVLRYLFLDKYQVILGYLLIFSLIFILILKRKKAVFTFLVLLTALQVPVIYQKFQVPKQELFVFNSGKNSLIGFIENDTANLLIDKNLPDGRMERIVKPVLSRKGIKKIVQDTLKPVEIRVMGSSVIAIFDKKINMSQSDLNLIQPDYIILRKGGLQSYPLLTEYFPGVHIVLDASVYHSDRQKFLPLQENYSGNLYDVKKSGAFVCNLDFQ